MLITVITTLRSPSDGGTRATQSFVRLGVTLVAGLTYRRMDKRTTEQPSKRGGVFGDTSSNLELTLEGLGFAIGARNALNVNDKSLLKVSKVSLTVVN